MQELLSANGLRAIHSASHPSRRSEFSMSLTLCSFEQKCLESISSFGLSDNRIISPGQELEEERKHYASVFVSYAHEDKQWLDSLRSHLEPSLRNGEIQLSDDTTIEPGKKWHDTIASALQACHVAVLLVTQAFVSSEYIASNELPVLLRAAEERGLIILWVPISHSSWKETGLRELQAAYSVDTPLSELSPARMERALVEIATKVREATRPTRDKGKSRPHRG